MLCESQTVRMFGAISHPAELSGAPLCPDPVHVQLLLRLGRCAAPHLADRRVESAACYTGRGSEDTQALQGFTAARRRLRLPRCCIMRGPEPRTLRRRAELGLLVLTGCTCLSQPMNAKVAYEKITYGTCDTHTDAAIPTLSECSAAAVALGTPGSGAEGTTTGDRQRPAWLLRQWNALVQLAGIIACQGEPGTSRAV